MSELLFLLTVFFSIIHVKCHSQSNFSGMPFHVSIAYSLCQVAYSLCNCTLNVLHVVCRLLRYIILRAWHFGRIRLYLREAQKLCQLLEVLKIF